MNNFFLRTTFWKCLVPMPKCFWKVNHKNWTSLWQKLFKKVRHKIVAAYALARYRIVTHSNAASFSIKNILCENTNICFSKNYSKLGKTNARFWKNIQYKDKVTLDIFQNFAYVLFALRKFCLKTRLFNIFKTKNVTNLAKVILESS